MRLDSVQADRASGVLLGMACGDALGAGYEFGPALPDDEYVGMIGGGPFGFEPAEWTDDTSMGIAIAEALLDDESHALSRSAKDQIVRRWIVWSHSSKDVGMQTGAVLRGAESAAEADGRQVLAHDAYEASAQVHRQSGRSGGNGALMRTAPLALAYLDAEPAELRDAAMDLSSLTHFDPEAGEACALWCLAIRHAVLTGELDVRVGLEQLEESRAAKWRERIEVAERQRPRDFTHTGWVVEALEGAWSAICQGIARAESNADGLRCGLEESVRGGGDTDTVAAIAGGLLGAAYGLSAVPLEWQRELHGWPGIEATDLHQLGIQLVDGDS